MKKYFISLVIVMFFALSVKAQVIKTPNGEINIPPKRLLSYNDIKDLNISQIWILKNSIFAKHGRPFKTFELYNYFYQQRWYKPIKDVKIQLSEEEQKNVQLLLKREQELRKQNYIKRNKKNIININNIYNIFQYSELNDTQKQMLEKNGFFVTDDKSAQIFNFYEMNAYKGIPSFVTVDLPLYLTLTYIDQSLENVEKNFYKQLILILKLTYQAIETQSTGDLKDKTSKDFALAYLFIGQKLLNPNLPVPENNMFKSAIEQELNLIKNKNGWQQSPFFNKKVDYGQFLPRGHYTSNDTLKRYFKAMIWFGNIGLNLDNEMQMLASIKISNTFYKNKRIFQIYKKIDDFLKFFIGASDDISPIQMSELIKKYNQNIDTKEQFYLHTDELKNMIKELPEPKLTGHGSYSQQGKEFRLFGQKYIWDGEVFQNLTSKKRRKPMGLDLIASLGNKTAENLMTDMYKSTWVSSMPDYLQKVHKLQEQTSLYDENFWTSSIYNYTLWTIVSLFEPDKRNKQFSINSEGWKRKNLNTSLSAWALLRHSFILYAKNFPFAAECGGGDGEYKWVWHPEPPKGYVEPYPEAYNKMIGLLKKTQQVKGKNYTASKLINMLEFLKNISEKELNGQKITYEEYDQIQQIGSFAENIYLNIFNVTEMFSLGEEDQDMAKIADIGVTDNTTLEVGIGDANPIYVIIEIDGKLKLLTGAVFSYYEFSQPINNRLTDKAWQDMIDTQNEPPQQKWINFKLKNNNRFSPLNFNHQIYTIPPGWKKEFVEFDYDTGC